MPVLLPPPRAQGVWSLSVWSPFCVGDAGEERQGSLEARAGLPETLSVGEQCPAPWRRVWQPECWAAQGHRSWVGVSAGLTEASLERGRRPRLGKALLQQLLHWGAHLCSGVWCGGQAPIPPSVVKEE